VLPGVEDHGDQGLEIALAALFLNVQRPRLSAACWADSP
jgi:hypothetical protein